MNLHCRRILNAIRFLTLLLITTLAANLASAQSFFQASGTNHSSPNQAPPMPGALLAGGSAAAQGGQYMDAQGNSIVMPASYYQPCPSGYGTSPSGAYGDPMAVDFGGYGQDQCGPHYFDIAFETVFLTLDNLPAEGQRPFSNVGTTGDINGVLPTAPELDVSELGDEYEPGWRIAFRYDVGALALIEATYTGLYDIGYDAAVQNGGNQLISAYSNYGRLDGAVYPDGFVTGLDEASEHSIAYRSDLQSTEISYRRYWVGNNPRISGTYLLGARYTRLTEEFIFSATTALGDAGIGTFTEND